MRKELEAFLLLYFFFFSSRFFDALPKVFLYMIYRPLSNTNVASIGLTSLDILKKFEEVMFFKLLFVTRVIHDTPCALAYSR